MNTIDRRRSGEGASQPFEWLRPAREQAGVAIEEIADHTKIPLRLLKELERGDLRGWPRGIYAKAYARAYAAEIDLDPDAVIAAIMPSLPVGPKETHEEPAPGCQPRRPPKALLMVILVLVGAALLTFFTPYAWKAEAEEPVANAQIGEKVERPAERGPDRTLTRFGTRSVATPVSVPVPGAVLPVPPPRGI